MQVIGGVQEEQPHQRRCLASSVIARVILLLFVASQAAGMRQQQQQQQRADNGASPERHLLMLPAHPRLEEPLPEAKAVVLTTYFGPIRIRLLEKLAPRITAAVWQLAAARNCTSAYNCAFYRNEPVPSAELGQQPLGPPYALLQGRLYDLPEAPPFEGNVEVQRGHACIIPGGKDWFIALGHHPEWGTSHPVWGFVDDAASWRSIELIVSQAYSNYTNTDSNVTLRILKIEVPFVLSVESDRTYAGPLH